jgi:hypothetical protein
MTDKPSALKTLGEKLRAGLNNVNEQAKARAEKRPLAEEANGPETELDEVLDEAKPKTDERLSAVDDTDLEEGIIIEGDPQPEKSKRKGLDTKQKVLILGAIAIAGFWVLKHKDATPLPAEIAQTETVLPNATEPQQTSINQAEAPAFDFGKSSKPEAPIEMAGSNGDYSLGFGDGNSSSHDAANSPLGAEVVTADLNDQFSNMETTQTLDPFSGEVQTATVAPANLAAPSTAPVQAKQPSQSEPDSALLSADSKSPFSEGSSNFTELSGTKSQNPDSKGGVLQDQGAKADVANLQAKIAEKDGRIGTLESEVGKLKTDLADAMAKLEASTAHQSQTKAQASKQPQRKAVHPTQTTQHSPSTQRVATASKAVARPQICVTAVAQAARNCTTCVPHAFITHRGSETMIGQGDYIEGLRANIVGDRLDLQNAQGVVVHKFWSSPNGCAAG